MITLANQNGFVALLRRRYVSFCATFRASHRACLLLAEEGEALRRDDDFTFVSAWEFQGEPKDAALHKEELEYNNIELKQRSYK